MKFTIPLLALILVLAACQPSVQPTEVLPTVAVLPSGGTATINEPQTAEATAATTVEVTAENTGEATAEATESTIQTETQTAVPTNTLEPTQAAISTATEKALELPVYATFSAAPVGTLPPAGNFNQVADVLINEQQFQKEIDSALPAKPSIQSAVVDFVPGAIVVRMTTNGATSVSGTVTITVTLQNDLAAITIGDMTTDPMPPPQSYADVASVDMFQMMVGILDKIVKARIGPEQKLKSIAVTDTSINVTMLVP